MAISGGDGSIILTTKVDTSGMEQGTKSLKSQAAKLAAEYRKAGMSQSEAFKKAWSEIERTRKETEKATKSTQTYGEKAKSAFQGVGSALKSLAGYLALAFSVTKLIQFSNEAGQLATQTEASVKRLVDIYGSASDSVGNFIDANARALGMSKAAAASFSSVYGNLFSVWADQATNAELTNRYLNMTAVVASKTGRTVEDVQERIRSGLLGNTEAIEDLGVFVNVKTIEMTDAFKRMANGKSWEQLDAYTQQQIRSMAILEQATAKYGDEVANTSATIRNRYKAAYEDFQNSWGNIVNTVLLPVLETLTQIFDIAAKGLNALSGRSGQILENAEIQEENTYKTAENIKEQTENQKELNKELKKSVAEFDDIQILSANTVGNTNGGGLHSESQGIVGGFDGTAPDSSAFEETSQKIQDLAKVVAKAMIAIGCVLLATGNIGWGIGLIIAGAMAEGIVEASVGDGSSFQEIADKISNAIIIAGVVAIIIGLLLCVAQMWGLGIGLIIKGAVVVAGTVALNWDGIKEKLQGSLGGWFALGGIISIVLGILLCFTPFLPLGIGLIVLGAAAVVAPVVANWGSIKEKLQGSFGGWFALAGVIAIVLGILLCFTPFLPLGIGLIVLGVGAEVATIVANWDSIKEWITDAFNAVMDWLKIHGGLVLGILLLFTGVGAPFGMALIMDSVSAMGKGEEPVLWDSILESIKKTWNDIKSYWNENIANVWTLEFWLGLAKIAGNGLIEGFELAINGIIGMFETMINWIVDGLNKISFDVPDWVLGIGGKTFGIDIPEVEFGRISIPRLAKGAVIPPNREFLAVLGDQKQGTNIEAPLQTIVDAFNIALAQNGGYSGGNTEVVLEIDGREFGRAVVEQGNRENRRIGTRLVIA